VVDLDVASSGEDACCDDSEGASDVLLGDSVVVEPDRSSAGVKSIGFSVSATGIGEISGRGAFRGSFCSTMETTIFSKSPEVICRSRPRLRLLAHESCRRILGRIISTGVESEVNSTASSSASESTLPDS
jgi:hypothetical protein